MRFTELNLRLLTRDLEATIAFYTGTLGFTVETLWPPEDPTVCILDHGPVHLLFYTGGSEGAAETAATVQLTLETEGVEELYERLRGEVAVLWGPEVYH